MKILLIAPYQPELNTPLEIEQLGLGHQVVTLTGQVDHDRLTRATATTRFDAIHVAAHCANSEIQLSAGHILTRDQLSQMARKTRANLVFLNACDSANFAQSLVDTGIPVVIAWTVAVLDENGVRTACYFYDELLHNHEDLHAAYRKVTPQDGSFLFLAGLSYIEGILLPIVQRLDQLSQQLAHLIVIIARQRIALILLASLILTGLALAAALVFLPWPIAEGVPSGPEAEPLKLTQTAEPGTPWVTPMPTDTPVVEPVETTAPPSPTDTPVPATDSPPAPTATAGVPPGPKTPVDPPATEQPIVAAIEALPTRHATATLTTHAPPSVGELTEPTHEQARFTPWPTASATPTPAPLVVKPPPLPPCVTTPPSQPGAPSGPGTSVRQTPQTPQ